jgi:autoinducer 2-degrading protein
MSTSCPSTSTTSWRRAGRTTRRPCWSLRFDVLQSAEDPAYFILYEAYESAEAAAAHKTTPHYLRWKEVVAPWMAEPRRGEVFTGHCPEFGVG